MELQQTEEIKKVDGSQPKIEPAAEATPENLAAIVPVAEETIVEMKKKPGKNVDAKLLKLYVIPILSVVAFFMMNILVIVPKINAVIEDFSTINEKSGVIKEKNNVITKLKEVSANKSTTLNSELTILNSLAPSGQTQVVEYQNKISTLADQYNLRIVTQRTNDAFASQTSLELKEIPTEFEINGSFDDIRRFIDEISKLNDFVIVKKLALREVKANEDERNSEWSLEINLVKYQFADASEALFQSYLAIPIEAELPSSVQEYINNRLDIVENTLNF